MNERRTRMTVDPAEATIVLRIFREFADGHSESRIVRRLNEEGVKGRRRSHHGWSPATVHRVLRNEKYAGRWVWNRSETRRDPKTGRRRQFPKPESEWFVQSDEKLRIVPPDLWTAVERRLLEIRKTWPGGKGRTGFRGQTGGRAVHYPRHLLSGALTCGVCGGAIANVSGKAGGYYGCLGAAKRACANRLLVRRNLAEKIILAAIRERLSDPEKLLYVLKRLEIEIARLGSEAPESTRLKEAEYETESRRVANFISFIGDGRGSKAISEALTASERRVDELRGELEVLRRYKELEIKIPPMVWIENRVAQLQELLERRTEKSAQLLREILGKVRLEPAVSVKGRAHYRATSKLQVLLL